LHGAACENCVEKVDLVDAIIASRPTSKALQVRGRMEMVPVLPKVDITLDDTSVEPVSNRVVHQYREIREKQNELHGKRAEVLWGKMFLEREAYEVALNRTASIEAVRRDGESRCNTLETALESVTAAHNSSRVQHSQDVEWFSQALRHMTLAHNSSRLHHMRDVQWLESALESMSYLHNNSRQQHTRDVQWLQAAVYNLKQKDVMRLRDVANVWLVSCAVALLLCLGLAFQLASCAPVEDMAIEDMEASSSGPSLAHSFELLQLEPAMEEVESTATQLYGPLTKPVEEPSKDNESDDDTLGEEWTNIETDDANEVNEDDAEDSSIVAEMEASIRELDECDPCHWETL